jgi:sec-independent protein translocase protein TatA
MIGTLGMTELLVILGIALLIFGPRALPRISRSMGETVREVRDAAKEIRESIDRESS